MFKATSLRVAQANAGASMKNKHPRLAAKRLRYEDDNVFRDPSARFRKQPLNHSDNPSFNPSMRDAFIEAYRADRTAIIFGLDIASGPAPRAERAHIAHATPTDQPRPQDVVVDASE